MRRCTHWAEIVIDNKVIVGCDNEDHLVEELYRCKLEFPMDQDVSIDFNYGNPEWPPVPSDERIYAMLREVVEREESEGE
jgi:hypothetical protein